MAWSQEHRGSARSRGYGAKWRKARESVLRRDKYLCQPCKAMGRLTQAVEVDHIRNKADGGTDSMGNLQSICQQCHKDKAGTEVTGQVWPAVMSHVSAGLYRATLDADLDLSANRDYVAWIDATGSGGEVGHWEYPLKSQVRRQ